VSAPRAYVDAAPQNAARTKGACADDAMIHVGAFRHLPEVIAALGADPSDVCIAAGFDLKLFDDPSNLVTYRAATRLFRIGAQATRCPHFGLLVGERSGLDSLGIVGLLVKYSSDVRTALCNLVRYVHLHIRGSRTTLDDDGKVALLRHEIYAPGAEATEQVADGSLATIQNIVVALCGPEFRPSEVWFEHRQPEDVTPYTRLFNAPLRFGQDRNALLFGSSWLDRPLPPVEPALQRLLQDTVAKLEAQSGGDFPAQVRSHLPAALLTGQGSVEQVAMQLGMHSRTLHRRLAESGTNFRTLVDDCRYEIARQMLEDTEFDVSHIAGVLDYADTSAFARAFQRWSGSTPSHWRAARNITA
jgi:AraC-like DNA-binding protein